VISPGFFTYFVIGLKESPLLRLKARRIDRNRPGWKDKKKILKRNKLFFSALGWPFC